MRKRTRGACGAPEVRAGAKRAPTARSAREPKIHHERVAVRAAGAKAERFRAAAYGAHFALHGFMRRLALVLALLGGAAACASASEPDDHAVNGADQEITEAPCEPIASLKCRAGYHTISTARCDGEGTGRCVADSCEPQATLHCVSGWKPTTTACKSPSGTKYARCAAADAGAHDGGDAAR